MGDPWPTTALPSLRCLLGHASVILLAYAGGVWLLVTDRLSAGLDQRLREDFEVAESMLMATEDGGTRWRDADEASHEELEDQLSAEVWCRDGDLLLRR